MFRNLNAAQAVKRIYFSKRKAGTAAHIGGRIMGNIYAGRVVLANGKRQSVAIKVFKTPLNQSQAHAYQSAIYDLALAGVKLPKMFMHKLPKGTPLGIGALQKDSWVLVSQLFGSVKNGVRMSNGNASRFKTPEARLQVVEELTKIANAGYSPLKDIMNNLETQRGHEAIPIDLDFVVTHGKTTATERAKLLAQAILALSRGPTAEYTQLLRHAMKNANPELRELLEGQKLG